MCTCETTKEVDNMAKANGWKGAGTVILSTDPEIAQKLNLAGHQQKVVKQIKQDLCSFCDDVCPLRQSGQETPLRYSTNHSFVSPHGNASRGSL